ERRKQGQKRRFLFLRQNRDRPLGWLLRLLIVGQGIRLDVAAPAAPPENRADCDALFPQGGFPDLSAHSGPLLHVADLLLPSLRSLVAAPLEITIDRLGGNLRNGTLVEV